MIFCIGARMEDYALERLLELDGEVFVVSKDGQYWVKFEVHRVPPILSKPHGLDYSLTLHGPDNDRLVGFDNAHPVAPTKWGRPQDHRHSGKIAKPYEYSNAAELLADFWAAVDKIMSERGIK
jgi:Family of unknown function (DUF6516)